MPLAMHTEDRRWRSVKNLERSFKKAYNASLRKTEAQRVTTLLLSDDTTLQRLNREWRGKNKPTNVLSFPAPRDGVKVRGVPKFLGDIALSYDTCAVEAKLANKTLIDHATHLLVHGLLHLTGHDHEKDDEAGKMEAKEIRILAELGIPDPYVLND